MDFEEGHGFDDDIFVVFKRDYDYSDLSLLVLRFIFRRFFINLNYSFTKEIMKIFMVKNLKNTHLKE